MSASLDQSMPEDSGNTPRNVDPHSVPFGERSKSSAHENDIQWSRKFVLAQVRGVFRMSIG